MGANKMSGAVLGVGGIVAVPATMIDALHARPGDRIVFFVSPEGQVRLSTPRLLALSVWANNCENVPFDTDVRHSSDLQVSAAKWERVDADVAADDRSEDEISHMLLSALGL